MSALAKFLERNSAKLGKPLPLVHTTRAYFLKQILDRKKIDVIPCDVFNEPLAYFFVGRPAYKWETAGEAAEWELPVCFVFEYDVADAKRIFPFDTGAFKSKYPPYISMMDLDEFELSAVSHGPERLIGTFFASRLDYYLMRLRPAHRFNDEFLVDLLDSEVKAVHKLWSSSASSADDRRCAIEVQFQDAITLDKGKLLAVILPDIYLEHPTMRGFLRRSGAKAYGYSVYTLNSAAFFSQIYDYVKLFYEKRGLLNV
ncbi:MAG: hypothetical protein ACREE2_13465 [Stellaceae bacterium]